MINSFNLRLITLCLFACGSRPAPAAEPICFSLQETEKGVAVRINGELFTEYLTRSGTKPILWPIIGPTGKPMTRAYPMRAGSAHEGKDHPYHRSLWFTQQYVGGADFWVEPEFNESHSENIGEQVHREFVKLEADGRAATIITKNDWRDARDAIVCKDVRTLVFGATTDSRWIDFQIELKASERDLPIGDSKEGTFGVRVAETMAVEAGLGGRIVNSRGQIDQKAWGMPAEWVDYHGPVSGKRVGIAIFSHPSNFRPTPRWHVRTYGLFTANPFGEAPFPKLNDYKQGPINIPSGNSLKLRYRVFMHRGDEREGQVAAAYHRFAHSVAESVK